MTGEIGAIDESGVFTAAKTGTDLTGTITASYGETSFSLKVTVGSSQPFADTKGHWAESYITDLYYAGTLQGSTKDGKLYYRPDASMTRQEFIVAMMRYLGTDLSAYQTVSLPTAARLPIGQNPRCRRRTRSAISQARRQTASFWPSPARRSPGRRP